MRGGVPRGAAYCVAERILLFRGIDTFCLSQQKVSKECDSREKPMFSPLRIPLPSCDTVSLFSLWNFSAVIWDAIASVQTLYPLNRMIESTYALPRGRSVFYVLEIDSITG